MVFEVGKSCYFTIRLDLRLQMSSTRLLWRRRIPWMKWNTQNPIPLDSRRPPSSTLGWIRRIYQIETSLTSLQCRSCRRVFANHQHRSKCHRLHSFTNGCPSHDKPIHVEDSQQFLHSASHNRSGISVSGKRTPSVTQSKHSSCLIFVTESRVESCGAQHTHTAHKATHTQSAIAAQRKLFEFILV